jgi:NADH-quinone oxidoreductase subunit L
MDLTTVLATILLLPLASAGFITLCLRRRGYAAAAVSVVVGFVLMALALGAVLNWNGQPLHRSWEWIRFGNFAYTMGFYFDHQAALMLLVVTFVAGWIQLFSVGYMDDDPAKGRFFGGLSIFMFSILGITLADNLIMLFVFWELVGFSSYMLIAHYYTTDFANMASKKAFIVNRIGDFGFILGIVWCYHYYGTVDLEALRNLTHLNAPLLQTSAAVGIGLLLMCGFIGKSAQFPLQVWLTDAMAGPTPVSALIHAATMVAAGIYFLARVYFLLPPFTLHWIMWSGALMTAFAGLCALGQTDIKKSLAYSTLSHLGYMATAVGLGYPELALFHMAMHACFKATLFLGAGSVIHSCHHEQDIYKMGGLFRRMPITGLTFGAASLAIAAIPFFSGSYSKDTIITAAFLKGMNEGPQYYLVYVLVLFAALCTALYMGRLFCVAFLGQPRSEHAAHAHESSAFMTIPLAVLGFLSVVAGWVVYHWDWAQGRMNWVMPSAATEVFVPTYHAVETLAAQAGVGHALDLVAIALAVAGLVGVGVFYGRARAGDPLQARAPGVFQVLERHGWFDDLYDWYVAKVQQCACEMAAIGDLLIVKFVFVQGTAAITGLTGALLKRVHVGSLHAYVYWFLGGVLLFWAFALGWF